MDSENRSSDFKIAVLSDVNGNLEALTCVLAELKNEGIEDVLFLGDAIGYGANPVECLALLRARANTYILGRLEQAIVCGKLDAYNSKVRGMLEWTRDELNHAPSRDDEVAPLSWLRERKNLYRKNDLVAVHGPNTWDEETYMFNNVNVDLVGQLSNRVQGFRILLIGDNHEPWALSCKRGKVRADSNMDNIKLEADDSFIISVGSVGQPRDGDPRACFAIVSPQTVVWRRVPYDIEATARKMGENPVLHSGWANRLRKGI